MFKNLNRDLKTSIREFKFQVKNYDPYIISNSIRNALNKDIYSPLWLIGWEITQSLIVKTHVCFVITVWFVNILLHFVTLWFFVVFFICQFVSIDQFSMLNGKISVSMTQIDCYICIKTFWSELSGYPRRT